MSDSFQGNLARIFKDFNTMALTRKSAKNIQGLEALHCLKPHIPVDSDGVIKLTDYLNANCSATSDVEAQVELSDEVEVWDSKNVEYLKTLASSFSALTQDLERMDQSDTFFLRSEDFLRWVNFTSGRSKILTAEAYQLGFSIEKIWLQLLRDPQHETLRKALVMAKEARTLSPAEISSFTSRTDQLFLFSLTSNFDFWATGVRRNTKENVIAAWMVLTEIFVRNGDFLLAYLPEDLANQLHYDNGINGVTLIGGDYSKEELLTVEVLWDSSGESLEEAEKSLRSALLSVKKLSE